ncbi:MAG: hypothetical protein ACPGLV_15815 [Bacteroidia bacterium]
MKWLKVNTNKRNAFWCFICFFSVFTCYAQSNVNAPFILDSLTRATDTLFIKDAKISNYIPLYFGPKSDTITVSYHIRKLQNKEMQFVRDYNILNREFKSNNDSFAVQLNFYHSYYPLYKYKSGFDSTNVNLTVSVLTDQLIKNINFSRFKTDYNSPAFAAYPIIIENNDSVALAIGYGNYIYANLEYFDNLIKKWIPFDHVTTYSCGTGVPNIILHPNQIAVTSVPIIKGFKNMSLRLKIGNAVSNEFKFNLKNN